jgi:hypothetical protein
MVNHSVASFPMKRCSGPGLRCCFNKQWKQGMLEMLTRLRAASCHGTLVRTEEFNAPTETHIVNAKGLAGVSRQGKLDLA